jgi:hypothetical protein
MRSIGAAHFSVKEHDACSVPEMLPSYAEA